MTTIAYIFIGIGLLLTFFLWNTWRNKDRIMEEYDIPQEEIYATMKSLHWKIYFCYGLAIVFKFLS